VLNPATRVRLLKILLRLAGAFTVVAFPTMLLPTDWMASTHHWLGLGEFPEAPIVDYLARSVAALYGFHGVLLLLVSRNPVRFRAIVTFIGVMNIAFGVMMILVDIHAGLPTFWLLAEGPPIIAFGAVVGLLNHGAGEAAAKQPAAV
jgi:hypothetical protein